MRLTSLLMPFVVVTCSAAEDDADLRARFLAEYGPAFTRAAERLSKNWRGVVREKEFREDGTIDYDETVEFLANDRCVRAKVTRTYRRMSDITEVNWHLLRPDGIYEVHPAKQPDAYILKRSRLGEKTVPEADYPFSFMVYPLTMRSTPMVAYVQRPQLRIVEFGESRKEGVELKRLKVAGTTSSTTLTFWFDPAKDWLLHSYIIEPGNDRSDRRPTLFRFHYRTLDEETIPQGHEVYRIEPNGQEVLWGSTDYEFERAYPPDSEFTLTQFGLPEMGNFKPRAKPTPMYVWIIVVAAGSSVVALIFAYLARRRAARTTTTPQG